ncbi:MAG TPA: fatty acid desaturase [Candidatus Binataceae bacterium]|nr:fatty acid desaturase [Candidatus Binataceae bacterium]
MADQVSDMLGADLETGRVPRNYGDLIKSANLSRDEIRELHRINNGRAILDFLSAILATAAVPLLYALYPHPLTAAVCVLLSIHNFNCFAQIAHASGHRKLVTDPRWNDRIGDLASAFDGYRLRGHAAAHQIHHVKLNTPEDADLIWGRPDQPTSEIARLWLQDLFMISAVQRFLQYLRGNKGSAATTGASKFSPSALFTMARNLLPVASVQCIIVLYYTALLGPQFYLYFYVLPILTLYPAQIRLRTACEHGFEAGFSPRTPDERWVTRSTQANFFERFVIVPLHGEYHFEHHVLPNAPYYNLPRVRRIFKERGIKVPLAPGYFRFVLQRWRAERTSGLREQNSAV